MNKIILTGRLTKDPELTTTPNGISVTKFALAVQRRYTNEAGERECDFINCVAWRTLADTVHKYCKKGVKIGIVGEVQTRNYEAQDGTKRYVFEVIANDIEFLTPKSETQDTEQLQPIEDQTNPFESQEQTKLIPNDDSLPF